MNKSDLISAPAQGMELTQRKAEEIVNPFFGTMTDAVVRGDRIEIR